MIDEDLSNDILSQNQNKNNQLLVKQILSQCDSQDIIPIYLFQKNKLMKCEESKESINLDQVELTQERKSMMKIESKFNCQNQMVKQENNQKEELFIINQQNPYQLKEILIKDQNLISRKVNNLNKQLKIQKKDQIFSQTNSKYFQSEEMNYQLPFKCLTKFAYYDLTKLKKEIPQNEIQGKLFQYLNITSDDLSDNKINQISNQDFAKKLTQPIIKRDQFKENDSNISKKQLKNSEQFVSSNYQYEQPRNNGDEFSDYLTQNEKFEESGCNQITKQNDEIIDLSNHSISNQEIENQIQRKRCQIANDLTICKKHKKNCIQFISDKRSQIDDQDITIFKKYFKNCKQLENSNQQSTKKRNSLSSGFQNQQESVQDNVKYQNFQFNCQINNQEDFFKNKLSNQEIVEKLIQMIRSQVNNNDLTISKKYQKNFKQLINLNCQQILLIDSSSILKLISDNYSNSTINYLIEIINSKIQNQDISKNLIQRKKGQIEVDDLTVFKKDKKNFSQQLINSYYQHLSSINILYSQSDCFIQQKLVQDINQNKHFQKIQRGQELQSDLVIVKKDKQKLQFQQYQGKKQLCQVNNTNNISQEKNDIKENKINVFKSKEKKYYQYLNIFQQKINISEIESDCFTCSKEHSYQIQNKINSIEYENSNQGEKTSFEGIKQQRGVDCIENILTDNNEKDKDILIDQEMYENNLHLIEQVIQKCRMHDTFEFSQILQQGISKQYIDHQDDFYEEEMAIQIKSNDIKKLSDQEIIDQPLSYQEKQMTDEDVEYLKSKGFQLDKYLCSGGEADIFTFQDQNQKKQILRIIKTKNERKYKIQQIREFQIGSLFKDKQNFIKYKDAHYVVDERGNSLLWTIFVMDQFEMNFSQKLRKQREYINKQKKFGIEGVFKQALDYTIQLLNILIELRQKYVYHQDIKPSNILINEQNKLVLCDFGGLVKVDINNPFLTRSNTFTESYKPKKNILCFYHDIYSVIMTIKQIMQFMCNKQQKQLLIKFVSPLCKDDDKSVTLDCIKFPRLFIDTIINEPDKEIEQFLTEYFHQLIQNIKINKESKIFNYQLQLTQVNLAINIRSKVNISQGQKINLYFIKANVLFKRKEFYKSIKYYRECLKQIKQQENNLEDNKQIQLECIKNISLIYKKLKSYFNSLEIQYKCLDLLLETRQKNKIANQYFEIIISLLYVKFSNKIYINFINYFDLFKERKKYFRNQILQFQMKFLKYLKDQRVNQNQIFKYVQQQILLNYQGSIEHQQIKEKLNKYIGLYMYRYYKYCLKQLKNQNDNLYLLDQKVTQSQMDKALLHAIQVIENYLKIINKNEYFKLNKKQIFKFTIILIKCYISKQDFQKVFEKIKELNLEQVLDQLDEVIQKDMKYPELIRNQQIILKYYHKLNRIFCYVDKNYFLMQIETFNNLETIQQKVKNIDLLKLHQVKENFNNSNQKNILRELILIKFFKKQMTLHQIEKNNLRECSNYVRIFENVKLQYLFLQDYKLTNFHSQEQFVEQFEAINTKDKEELFVRIQNIENLQSNQLSLKEIFKDIRSLFNFINRNYENFVKIKESVLFNKHAVLIFERKADFNNLEEELYLIKQKQKQFQTFKFIQMLKCIIESASIFHECQVFDFNLKLDSFVVNEYGNCLYSDIKFVIINQREFNNKKLKCFINYFINSTLKIIEIYLESSNENQLFATELFQQIKIIQNSIIQLNDDKINSEECIDQIIHEINHHFNHLKNQI